MQTGLSSLLKVPFSSRNQRWGLELKTRTRVALESRFWRLQTRLGLDPQRLETRLDSSSKTRGQSLFYALMNGKPDKLCPLLLIPTLSCYNSRLRGASVCVTRHAQQLLCVEPFIIFKY